MAVRATFKALQKKLHMYTSTGLPYEWNQTMIQEVNTKNAGLTRGVIFICCVSNTPQKICLLGMLSSHHIHTLRTKRRGFRDKFDGMLRECQNQVKRDHKQIAHLIK